MYVSKNIKKEYSWREEKNQKGKTDKEATDEQMQQFRYVQRVTQSQSWVGEITEGSKI